MIVEWRPCARRIVGADSVPLLPGLFVNGLRIRQSDLAGVVLEESLNFHGGGGHFGDVLLLDTEFTHPFVRADIGGQRFDSCDTIGRSHYLADRGVTVCGDRCIEPHDMGQ